MCRGVSAVQSIYLEPRRLNNGDPIITGPVEQIVRLCQDVLFFPACRTLLTTGAWSLHCQLCFTGFVLTRLENLVTQLRVI